MKGFKQIADVTCLGCGCLCDDITLEVVDEKRIVCAERACPLGEQWFLTNRPTDVPACHIDGTPASLEAGVERAAEILAAARNPLFIGLSGLTCEAQRVAVALADRLGGRVESRTGLPTTFDGAMRAVGIVTATLGEVRHRADLVIFWGVNPATTHPRHCERYSLAPRGEFIAGGRADRTCVVINSDRTPTTELADVFLQIRSQSDDAVTELLQLLATEAPSLNAADVESRTGVPLTEWRNLVNRIQSARYTAIFVEEGLTSESLLTFVRDMNQRTRCVCLTLGDAGNAAGASQLLAWQTGFSEAVDFSDGWPRQTYDALTGEAAVVFASEPAADPIDTLSSIAREHLVSIPKIVFHTASVALPPEAAVGFTVATPGIHTAGTVFRSDGVPLPLRPAFPSPYPTADAMLAAIDRTIGRIRQSASST